MNTEAVVTTVDCVIRKVKAVVTTTIAVVMDEEAVVTTVDCVIRKVKAVVTTTIAVVMNTEAVVTTTEAVVITAIVVIMVVSARCQMVTADEKFYNALLSSTYVSNLL